jgi:hypothetical protein
MPALRSSIWGLTSIMSNFGIENPRDIIADLDQALKKVSEARL